MSKNTFPPRCRCRRRVRRPRGAVWAIYCASSRCRESFNVTQPHRSTFAPACISISSASSSSWIPSHLFPPPHFRLDFWPAISSRSPRPLIHFRTVSRRKIQCNCEQCPRVRVVLILSIRLTRRGFFSIKRNRKFPVAPREWTCGRGMPHARTVGGRNSDQINFSLSLLLL